MCLQPQPPSMGDRGVTASELWGASRDAAIIYVRRWKVGCMSSCLMLRFVSRQYCRGDIELVRVGSTTPHVGIELVFGKFSCQCLHSMSSVILALYCWWDYRQCVRRLALRVQKCQKMRSSYSSVPTPTSTEPNAVINSPGKHFLEVGRNSLLT